MAFFLGGEINTNKVRELSAQGLNVSQIASAMGHSRAGIEQHCIKHSIAYTLAERCKWVDVNGVKMTVGDACALFGFEREALYAWRVKRGLELQEGFEAYVLYRASKTTDKPVLTMDSCIVKFKGDSYKLKELCNLLKLNTKSVDIFMSQNRYRQAAFERYCYAKGIR